MADLVQTVVTAAAAVTGTLVGSLTSFATSHFVQRRQGRSERVLRDIERREDLYGRFNELAAQLVGLCPDKLKQRVTRVQKRPPSRRRLPPPRGFVITPCCSFQPSEI